MNSSSKASIAKALLEVGAVTFSPEIPYTFTSGLRSPVYVDNRVLVYHPNAWRTIVEGFQSNIVSLDLRFDVIAGVAVGGVPHSSALAYAMRVPSVFIRKESKAHGKRQLIEGGRVADKRVLLVEDHVSTGGSALEAVKAMRAEGAIVECALAIISYRFPAAIDAFMEAELDLETLTDFDVLLELTLERGELSEQQLPLIRQWFADPKTWGKQFD